MYYFHLRMAVLTVSLCAITRIADALPAPQKITLRDALEATLAHNPQLNSFHFRDDMLRGEYETAALKPPLQIAVEAENIAGSGAYSAVKNAELTLSLAQIIELGDKRAARVEAVTERKRALGAEQRVLELDILAQVTRCFITVAAAQERVQLQQHAVTLAQETLTAIAHRVEIGHTADAELARAKANLGRLINAQQHAETELNNARISLALMWAESSPDFAGVTAGIFYTPRPKPLAQLLDNLENNPDIQQLASEERISTAQVRVARASRSSDLQWSAGVRHFQSSGDNALVVGLSVPLNSGARANGAITSALAQELAASNAKDIAIIKLRAHITALHAELNQSIDATTRLQQTILPQLQTARRDTRDAFAQGRYSYLEWNSAQQEFIAAEAEAIDAAERAHQLQTELERLTGTSAAEY